MDGWTTRSSFLLKNASFFRFQTNCSFLKESTYQLILIWKWYTHGPWPPLHGFDWPPETKKKHVYFGIGNVLCSCLVVFLFTLSSRDQVCKKEYHQDLTTSVLIVYQGIPASIEYILDLTPPPSYCGNCWFIRIPYSKYVTILMVPVTGWGGRSKVYLHLRIFEVEVYEEEIQQKSTRKWPKKLSPQRKGPCWKEMNHQSTEIWPIFFCRRLAAWHLNNEKRDDAITLPPSRISACFFFTVVDGWNLKMLHYLRCIKPGGWDISKITWFWMFGNPSPQKTTLR